MLLELRVRELGVIDELCLALGPGLTVVTGETGAGKTLVVDALALLLGGRADPVAVRSGALEAVVEGRFLAPRAPAPGAGAPAGDTPAGDTPAGDDPAGDDPAGSSTGDGDEEVVLARIVPANGRARAFVDGRMATSAFLAETGTALVDLYGQHAQQSLLGAAAQRAALDRFAATDLAPVRRLRAELKALEARLDALGGDGAARLRELDLLGFQLDEIARVAVASPDEDERLAEEELRLAEAVAIREACWSAHTLLVGTGGDDGSCASDLAGAAIDLLGRHGALGSAAGRLGDLVAGIGEVASELRRAGEASEEDPERLAVVRERRNLLHGLCRKYGPGLDDVLRFEKEAAARLADLQASDERRAALEAEHDATGHRLRQAEAALGDARRAAAPALAAAVESHLTELALDGARIVVSVPEAGIGDAVELLLGANRGEDPVPLAKAASGGELSRVMLALRLVLSAGPPTLVFDEVDAGIGGATGLAVGRALAELAREHQVLVVTHLAQVAAFADRHVRVAKQVLGERVVTRVEVVEGEERVAELSRMLSGHPDSAAAREHAAELLRRAGAGDPGAAAAARGALRGPGRTGRPRRGAT